MAMSTGGTVPSVRALALLNLTVQRASRSLCRSLAGLAFQASGMRPSLMVFFSSSVLDRKSTRLNSSDANISYAVFFVKKEVADEAHGRRVSDVSSHVDRYGRDRYL